MKSRIRALVFSLLSAVMFISCPAAMAQQDEFEGQIESPTSVVGGEVPNISKSYYDIHQRQSMYMERTWLFKKSIEERRESYVKPQWEAIKRYRLNLEKTYEKLAREREREEERKERELEREKRREEMRKQRAAERDARQKERDAEREKRKEEREKKVLDNADKEEAALIQKPKPEAAEDKMAAAEKAKSIEPSSGAEEEQIADAGEATGVLEKELPPAVNKEGKETGRKVVMPEDAPEFDVNPFD